MKVKCLFFASLRNAVGEEELEFELPGQSRVADLLSLLEQRLPQLARYRRSYKVAVDQTFVESDQELQDGAEVALLPPVSGGGADFVGLSDQPLSSDEALRAVQRPDCGAVSLFLGTVRNYHQDQVVTHLDYSSYETMAQSEMESLVALARQKWQLGSIYLAHRTGRVEAGDPAVVVAVSSAHRAEAFDSSRWLIDNLKARVPIWKKEVGPGGAVWIEGDARIAT